MAWQAYEVVFRLRSPLHVGWSKVGNLQRTRPYVLGRTLWGALTMRLTRLEAQGSATSEDYGTMGDKVNSHLAFTYLFPALRFGSADDHSYRPAWFWEPDFAVRFLCGYASTALDYPQQTAQEGALHETEYLSPYTRHPIEPVFLVGYIFDRDGAFSWQRSLPHIQLGADRCYGWGRVEVVHVEHNELARGLPLFNLPCIVDLEGERPLIHLHVSPGQPQRLLAHTHLDTRLPVRGWLEPLVGREWRATPVTPGPGHHVAFCGVCFQPGSEIYHSDDTEQTYTFRIGPWGVWEYLPPT